MLLNIRIENERQMLYVNLNRDDYSCYSDEQEVLLQAGLSFKLLSVEKQTMGRGPTEPDRIQPLHLRPDGHEIAEKAVVDLLHTNAILYFAILSRLLSAETN